MSDNKTMINPNYSNPRRQARIEREEKELEELMKQAQEPQEEPEEEEEETPEEEPEVEEKPQKKETPEEEKDEKLSKEEQTFKKRYGDLRRHSQKVEKELREEIDKLKKKNPDVIPPTSDEDLDEWAKKYPQVASIVSTIADKKAKEMMEAAEERLSKIDELQAEANRKTAEAKILEAHSDFVELRESDEFHAWAEEQAKWVQDALYENEDDPKSVISVIDLYKFKTGKTPADKKQKQKAAASTTPKGKASEPATNTGKKIKESVVAKMSDEEYEENEEAIMEAMRTGNFVYDMTGGVR